MRSFHERRSSPSSKTRGCSNRDVTSEAGALSSSSTRHKNNVLLLDQHHSSTNITAHKAGNHFAFYSLFPLDKSTCGEIGSDFHTLIKELDIREMEQISKFHFETDQGTSSRKEDRDSESSVEIFFCLTADRCFLSSPGIISQTGYGACRQHGPFTTK